MEWAQRQRVRLNPQRTIANSLERLHGIDDVPKRQLARGPREHEPAVDATLGADQFYTGEPTHEFREVGRRNARNLRDLLDGAGLPVVLGDGDDGAERVLDGLGDHASPRGSPAKKNRIFGP